MKKKVKKKNQAITLIEIMIVILLIGLIGGALAFNMRGSMDEGKRFKTRQNIARVEDILTLEQAQGNLSLDEIAQEWETIVADSPLVKHRGRDLIVDGWNQKLNVTIENHEIKVFSNNMPNA